MSRRAAARRMASADRSVCSCVRDAARPRCRNWHRIVCFPTRLTRVCDTAHRAKILNAFRSHVPCDIRIQRRVRCGVARRASRGGICTSPSRPGSAASAAAVTASRLCVPSSSHLGEEGGELFFQDSARAHHINHRPGNRFGQTRIRLHGLQRNNGSCTASLLWSGWLLCCFC